MDFPPYLRWAAVFLVAVLVFIWHWMQSKSYAARLKAAGREQDALSRKILSLSFDRALQMLFVWGIVLAILVYTDQRLVPLRTQLESLRTELSVAQEQLAEDDDGPQLNVVVEENSEEYQAKLDSIKERFEPLFINYYYLKRCNLTSPDDFHLMNSSLMYELAAINAPAGLRSSILSASKGSHDEIYANASCEPSATAPLKNNVDAYLNSVRTNIPN